MTALLISLFALALTVLCVRLVTALPRGGRRADQAAIARMHAKTYGRSHR